jgi:hypothetical protein
MKKKYDVKILLLLVFIVTGIFSQTQKNSYVFNRPDNMQVKPGGLLDPSRFSLSHQYTFSYSSSSSGSGNADGLFLSTLRYQFSVPVTLRLDMGYAHQMGSLFGISPAYGVSSGNSVVFPHAELTYKPFDNTIIRLQYFDNTHMSQAYSPFSDFGPANLLYTPTK